MWNAKKQYRCVSRALTINRAAPQTSRTRACARLISPRARQALNSAKDSALSASGQRTCLAPLLRLAL